MKRIEVRLSLPVVAPLLDVVRELSKDLKRELPAGRAPGDVDTDLGEAWQGDLLGAQQRDLEMLLGLFGEEFFSEGVVSFDGRNAEAIARACSAVRLRLRERFLREIGDEALETGEVDLPRLDPWTAKAFTCYLFLATIQELIIQHLDESIIGS